MRWGDTKYTFSLAPLRQFARAVLVPPWAYVTYVTGRGGGAAWELLVLPPTSINNVNSRAVSQRCFSHRCATCFSSIPTAVVRSRPCATSSVLHVLCLRSVWSASNHAESLACLANANVRLFFFFFFFLSPPKSMLLRITPENIFLLSKRHAPGASCYQYNIPIVTGCIILVLPLGLEGARTVQLVRIGCSCSLWSCNFHEATSNNWSGPASRGSLKGAFDFHRTPFLKFLQGLVSNSTK